MKTLTGICLLAMAAGCATDATTSDDCVGHKCDTPATTVDDQCASKCAGDEACMATCREQAAVGLCETRRDEALSGEFGTPFVRDAIRWSCADVEGVTADGGTDDRGQEYCEYYAIVQPPPRENDGTLPNAAVIGMQLNESGDTTPLALEFDQAQQSWLEKNPSEVVGQCVFRSWHSDIDGALANCTQESCPEFQLPQAVAWNDTTVTRSLGVPLTAEFAQMKLSFNSNFAAADLVHACLSEVQTGDPSNPTDGRHDNYIRGCMKAFDLFQTEWRKSDSAVCVAAMRLNECGCGLDVDGQPGIDVTTTELNDVEEFVDDNGQPVFYRKLARLVVPRTGLRGFKLGHWSGIDRLPSGCRYVETGENGQNLVTCDLTARQLTANGYEGAKDAKEVCRQEYGSNVVVHVPLPGELMTCADIAPEGQYAASCEVGNDMPWVDLGVE